MVTAQHLHLTHHEQLLPTHAPSEVVDTEKTFGFRVPFTVHRFADHSPYVPTVDTTYRFDPATTLAILAGFTFRRNTLIQGLHGTGKSSHLEQVAARLHWPLVRVNLDSHISRVDLIGRDAIVLKEGKQVTEFVEGILPWALQRPVALVLDEYDAGRPDVMFVIQRVLEGEGKLTLLDQNRILSPHPSFRLFATTNTIGLGDATGLYHGTQPINQGQMDRWHVVTTLNYLKPEEEEQILFAKHPDFSAEDTKPLIRQMVAMANLIRQAFMNGDISTVMSPRTVLSWAENYLIFRDESLAFRLSFLNKCDESERPLLAELYQRCFGTDLPESAWM